jgi:hypothetical protein
MKFLSKRVAQRMCPALLSQEGSVIEDHARGGSKAAFLKSLREEPPLALPLRDNAALLTQEGGARSTRFSTGLFAVLLAASVVSAEAQVKTEEKTTQPKTEAAQSKTQEPAQAKTESAQAPTQPVQQAETKEDSKLISTPGSKALGMSILGNQEAPKSLVIVPWKSSELGNAPGVSTMLDDSRLPVDKEVFMRMLSYYEIRSGTAPSGAPASADTQRRKQ